VLPKAGRFNETFVEAMARCHSSWARVEKRNRNIDWVGWE